jgi:hypothetical protein
MPIYVGSKKVKHIIHIKQYEYSVDSNAGYVYSLARGKNVTNINTPFVYGMKIVTNDEEETEKNNWFTFSQDGTGFKIRVISNKPDLPLHIFNPHNYCGDISGEYYAEYHKIYPFAGQMKSLIDDSIDIDFKVPLEYINSAYNTVEDKKYIAEIQWQFVTRNYEDNNQNWSSSVAIGFKKFARAMAMNYYQTGMNIGFTTNIISYKYQEDVWRDAVIPMDIMTSPANVNMRYGINRYYNPVGLFLNSQLTSINTLTVTIDKPSLYYCDMAVGCKIGLIYKGKENNISSYFKTNQIKWYNADFTPYDDELDKDVTFVPKSNSTNFSFNFKVEEDDNVLGQLAYNGNIGIVVCPYFIVNDYNREGTGNFSVNLKVIADGNTIYSYTIKGTELKPS